MQPRTHIVANRPRTLGFLALLALGHPVAGQTISGCSEVQCPGGSTPSCSVAGSVFQAVGVATVPDAPVDLAGMAWTEGVSVQTKTDQGKTSRVYERSFLLGTPRSAGDGTLATFEGCAIFFGNVSASVKFPDAANGAGVEAAQGTCQDALKAECVDKIIARAKGLVYSKSNAETCQALMDSFAQNLDDECKAAAGAKWEGLVAKPLTEIKVITVDGNKTSDCWPTLPKSNYLSPVDTISITGDSTLQSIQTGVYGITPILTVFYTDKTRVDTRSAQLTCLKAMGTTAGGATGSSQ